MYEIPITDSRDLDAATGDAVAALARLARLAELASDAAPREAFAARVQEYLIPALVDIINGTADGLNDFDLDDAEEAGNLRLARSRRRRLRRRWRALATVLPSSFAKASRPSRRPPCRARPGPSRSGSAAAGRADVFDLALGGW